MMTNIKRAFTDEDRAILNSYRAIIDGLSALMGSHCEIVLHSLEDPEHSTLYIVNGHNTNRQAGATLTEIDLQSLQTMEHGIELKPYFTRHKGNNGLMKSATMAIRNSKQQIIGLLCVNLNLEVPVSQFMQAFIPTQEHTVANANNFASSVEDLVLQTVENTIGEITADRLVANNNKNRQIVITLFEKGIFDIKDAINLVAERLNISRHTVYLYIRQIKQDDQR
ncbi:YheO-like protein [Pasteurella bettyae CCUG 2042]|uniref:YheO-like protein n=2 Tax=Pasteurella bettyae TaxID=752 RepID=I3DDQ8_9PAST|nr:transcriptional regulator [Pasteurella bettyae]EIJ69851.1 YheO-like protein [Pasteurella bettyae CCUG 2042]SUB22984.1 sulfur relay, TusB/DsrH family protein [Pasteurella bettyae]